MDRTALLKKRIMEIVEERWAETISQGAVQGSTHSKDVYDQLIAEGYDVRDGEMDKILAELSHSNQISVELILGSEDIRKHGNLQIFEPRWRVHQRRVNGLDP
jgi:hypothetical protein